MRLSSGDAVFFPECRMPGPTHATTLPETVTQFEKDIQDVHLIYDYVAQAADGTPEKWKYEMYVLYLTAFPPLLPSHPLLFKY